MTLDRCSDDPHALSISCSLLALRPGSSGLPCARTHGMYNVRAQCIGSAGLEFAGACALTWLPAVSPIKARKNLVNIERLNILFSDVPDIAPVIFRYVVLREW